MTSWPNWMIALWPPKTTLSLKGQALAVIGALIGIFISAFLAGYLRDQHLVTGWLFASLGASAVLVFAAPASPLAQPWNVVAGNAISALCGIVCFRLFGSTPLAGGLAVALSIGLMMQTRSLHPPGGGTALLAVIAHTSDFTFIAFPVAFDALILVLVGVAWHAISRRAYPKNQAPSRQPHNLALHRFVPDDLEAALSAHGETLDISRADIEKLIERTELHAYRRMASQLTCADIMTRRVHTINAAMNVRTAEKLMRRHDINALPVTDRDNRVLGLLRTEEAQGATAEATAGEAMMRDYFRRQADEPVVDLIDLFENSDRRYVVVLNGDALAGLIARSDLMAALFHAAA